MHSPLESRQPCNAEINNDRLADFRRWHWLRLDYQRHEVLRARIGLAGE